MVNKLALLIYHNIFLTNSQIEELLNKKKLLCEGVSVPVWVNAKNGKTTEPGCEFFIKYNILIEKENEDIIINKKGYEIHVSKINWKPPKPMINDENLEMEQKKYYERKRDKWWKDHPAPLDINLINETKYFRLQIKKLNQNFKKLKKESVDVQHTIEIKHIDFLLNSLC